MEERDLTPSKIDLIFILRIWLRYAKRFWALALVLAILGSGLLGYMGYRAYTPTYEASVSFTVKVSNPLYGSMNAYNNATAKQLNATFPYILRTPTHYLYSGIFMICMVGLYANTFSINTCNTFFKCS